MKRYKVLVVDDQPKLVKLLTTNLKTQGYEIIEAGTGKQAIELAALEMPDVVILDLMLPDMSGFEVCDQLRAMSDVPILMLTARTRDNDKLHGFRVGADDYITKPFNARELVARVRALLRLIRHTGGEPAANIIQAGDLAVDRDRHTATVAGQPVDLTPKEFDLLATLIADRGRVFGREMLLERVWGYDYIGESRTVDVHIQRLRQKIESDPANPRYLLTVRGIGYKFAAEEEL